jgi:hypothetical protein
MREILAEASRNPLTDSSSWRRDFRASATLAERLGGAIDAEAKRLKERQTRRPADISRPAQRARRTTLTSHTEQER